MAELLAVERVTAGYGDSVVLDDVSLAMQDGDSLALLGRNGVGKTTLLVTLMGFTRLRSAPCAGEAAISLRCRHSGAPRRDSAGCRRSASCFRRSPSRST